MLAVPSITDDDLMTALRAFLRSVLPTGRTVWTGRIAGTTMTVAALASGSSGSLAVGDAILGQGVAANTYIVALGTGTGGVGTYTIAPSQTVPGATAPVAKMYSGVPVIQAQVNRVPEMATDDFVLLTPKMRPRLSTNVISTDDVVFSGSLLAGVLTAADVEINMLLPGQYLLGADVVPGTRVLRQISGAPGGTGTYQVTGNQTLATQTIAAGGLQHLQPTEVVVQADVHGPNSANNAQTITTLFRDDYATTLMPPNIQPLFAEERGQMPFINAEQQWETRWVIDLHLQLNPVVRTPQEYADQLEADLFNVENLYPA